jgi:hypothetical protein
MEEVRRSSQEFVAGIQRQDSPAAMLRWFADGAFSNPVTRQITAFTGGNANAKTSVIRQYVAETLARAAAPLREPKARCPDPSAIKDVLGPGLQPDNDPVRDGFVLKRITSEILSTAEAETAPTEPQVVWLRSQIAQGRSLISMTVVCNGIPFAIVWGRAKSGKWLIEALAISLP